MAFVNRIGNVIKQTVSKHVSLESNASLYQAIRSMSSSKVFVGGLSYGTDEMSLREAFAQYGEVVEARVIMDRETGRSRGFGFVSYTSSEEASSAIQALDGQDLHGRRIRVNYATERPRAGGFGGGYGGGGGGYGGGYGAGGGGNYGGGGAYGGNSYGGDGSYSGGGGYNYGNSGGGYGGSESGSTAGANNFNSGYVGTGNAGNYNAAAGSGDYNSGYPGGGSFGSGGFGGVTGQSSTGGQEQFGANQAGTDALDEDFGQDTVDGDYKADDNEPNDYANTRG